MKNVCIFLGYFLISSYIFAQPVLQKSHNMMREGDKLIKQQVEYIDPGQEGKNAYWDISKQKLMDSSYKLNYYYHFGR